MDEKIKLGFDKEVKDELKSIPAEKKSHVKKEKDKKEDGKPRRSKKAT